jgi:Fe-S cluster assembly iron-binding protein IscA
MTCIFVCYSFKVFIHLYFCQRWAKTQRAIAELAKRGSNVLFHCRSGGCNGFEYVLEPVLDAGAADKQILSDDVTLWTCHQSMLHILGTEIDWKEYGVSFCV